MRGFFMGNPQPVGRKTVGKAAEPVGGIKSQIDGIEFDMADG